jgi:RNA polymerase sigma-70 factor (ECF subfamily)
LRPRTAETGDFSFDVGDARSRPDKDGRMDPLATSFVRFRDCGDLDSLGAVFDALAPRLMPIALHLCGHPADAEDAVQQTFLVAIERAQTFDESQRLEPWLVGVLANVARNRRREVRRRSAIELPTDLATADDVASHLEQRDLVAHLRTHVDALPNEQRQVLLMQMQHGLAPAEIAEVLGVPAGTVRMRLHRGLLALRKRMPAALVALLGAGLATRGLAAVRIAVMHAARRRLVAAATASTLLTTSRLWPILAMKKILAVCAAVLVAVIAWRTVGPPPSDLPNSAEGSESIAPSESRLPRMAATEPARDESTALSVERRLTLGSLRIRSLAATADGREVPVAGVALAIWSGDGEFEPFGDVAYRARTDARGEVVLSGLVPGVFSASLPALRGTRSCANVRAGEAAILELRTPARAIVTGRVEDPHGQPVSDAEVWVQRGTYLDRFSVPEATDLISRLAARTDAAGRFELAIVDHHESRISASRSGYGASYGRYVNNARGELRLVLLPDESRVTGIVRDENGAAVADALVTVRSGSDDSRRMADGTLIAGRVVRQTTTDADGRFRLAGLAHGATKLEAHAAPRHSAHREILLGRGETAEVELRTSAQVAVVGTVRHHDGTAPRAMVESRPSVDHAGHFSQCEVRPDGTFCLPYQPLGPFVLVVSCGRVDVAVRAMPGTTPGYVHCDIVLEAKDFARGRLVDHTGAALAGWGIHARGSVGGSSWCETAKDGRFELPLASAAIATVSVHPAGSDHVALLREGVRAGDTVELAVPAHAMPSGELRGRLLTAIGSPVAAAKLVLRSSTGSSFEFVTSADGSFRFVDLPAATFSLTYRNGGQEPELAAALALESAQQMDLGVIALPALASLDVEFVDASGRPWTAEPVGIELRDPTGREVDVVHSRASGRLVVTTTPGTYQLTIRGTDVLTAPQTVTLTTDAPAAVRVPLTIGRTRRLTFNGDGREKPANGTPLRVVLRQRDGEILSDRVITKLLPDLRGFRYWYSTHTLPMGRYEVEATTATGLRYQGFLLVDEDLEAPTSVEIPRVD